jgi:5'-nucleotidase
MTLHDRNHDFDNGVEGLYAQMPHAKFELSANYDFKNTIMEGQVKPYKIFNKTASGLVSLELELNLTV